ncbi:DUF397 domain-containing protein [Streptomyces sp. SM1]|uniref:DUF397 domain-containing protein n=1 Tax=Streptomyces sp. SM1 TaxID=402229 RepID=UPI000CD53289|nr:DUF397 domain-containing protein [Streptomyces sp. SM1]
MNAAAPSECPPAWFRSSYSNGAGGECMECVLRADGMDIRDSKDAESAVITVGRRAWGAFVRTIRQT